MHELQRDKRPNVLLVIPLVNEKERIVEQLRHFQATSFPCDVLIIDGGSSDGSIEAINELQLPNLSIICAERPNLSSQLLVGFDVALNHGYSSCITVDGNNKDCMRDLFSIYGALLTGYDFVQGSRFCIGGQSLNLPFDRRISLMLLHRPLARLFSRVRFSDTTNGFRGYSNRFLSQINQPLSEINKRPYDVSTALPIIAAKLKMKFCEVPVTRTYPKQGPVPTKISSVRGRLELFYSLIRSPKIASYVVKKNFEMQLTHLVASNTR